MRKQYNFTSISLLSDKYDGIIINISTVPDDISEFEKRTGKYKIKYFLVSKETIKLLYVKLVFIETIFC